MQSEPYANPQSLLLHNRRQISGILVGFYKSVKLGNSDAMACKKTRIFWRQCVGNIDTVRHARDYNVKYVVAPSGLCQEVVVKGFNRVFSHDVTTAMLVSQNKEMVAMLVSQAKPLGIELYFYANTFFCFSKPIWPVVT